MYQLILPLHSFLPYLLLAALIITIILFAFKLSQGKVFTTVDKKLAMTTLILAHLQALFGLLLYLVSPITKAALNSGEMMSNATYRFYAVEHVLVMIIAIVLITIGHSKAKKKVESAAKFKTILIFFVIALVLILVRIPWDAWLINV